MKRSLGYLGRHEFFIENAFLLLLSPSPFSLYLFPPSPPSPPFLPFSAGKKSGAALVYAPFGTVFRYYTLAFKQGGLGSGLG